MMGWWLLVTSARSSERGEISALHPNCDDAMITTYGEEASVVDRGREGPSKQTTRQTRVVNTQVASQRSGLRGGGRDGSSGGGGEGGGGGGGERRGGGATPARREGYVD